MRSLVRSTRLLAFVHLGLWLIWVGFWTIESSWYRCGLNANLSFLFETLPCFNHLFYKLAVECNCLLVKFQPYARMTRTIMFEEISVYTISCVRCSFYWSTKIYVFCVAVGFQAAPPKGGRVGSTLLWTTFFLLSPLPTLQIGDSTLYSLLLRRNLVSLCTALCFVRLLPRKRAA